MKTLTIFTPTYNRACRLEKLYNSLLSQTDKDFVWLIVDDGSVDNTSEVVDKFIGENKISIKYHKKENGGKHTAHNLGVELTDTELFCCVDSDDYLTVDAVEIIKKRYFEVKGDNLLGIFFKKMDLNGNYAQSKYPKGVKFIGISDLYFLTDFTGELVIVLKTEILKNYSFPIFEGEKFVTESVLYNQLNKGYKMYLANECIYCFDYLSDGYTKNAYKLIVSSPKGWALSKLSNAYYGKKLIYKTKAYSEYLSIIKVFNLDKNIFNDYKKPCFIIKILARFLNKHYYTLYSKIYNEYK